MPNARRGNCQSCGMPLAKDPKGGGTNKDGGLSSTYCSRCYEYGKFTQPTMTVEEMQALVKEKMKEMKLPSLVGWLFARSIPKLQRWRNKSE